MNNKKRKASDDEDSKDSKDEKNFSAQENELVDGDKNDSSVNATDQQKLSDNGAGTSKKKCSGDDKVANHDGTDEADQLTEQSDRKQMKLSSDKKAGVLLFCGSTNWDLIGRKELPKTAKNASGVNLWGPHRLASMSGIRIVSAYAGCCAVHSVIISENGQAYTWGRNDKGQLGHGDSLRRDTPTLVEALKDNVVISASCGRGHTLFLTEKGNVYSCGDNKMGQCGTGAQNNVVTVPTKVNFKGRSVRAVSCGGEFSVIVDCKGGCYTMGCPEYGQLGHNSDGRVFVTSNKLSYRCELTPRRIIAFIEKSREGHVTLVDDVQITSVASGINHTVAIDSKGRCFSWGFGGYGRLGHADPKDEMVPRLIKTFDGPSGRGVKRVYAGGTFSMAINIHDVLFFWGMNKRTGEATMYPKPVQDLCGWQVRDVACSYTSIVVVADESVISWGPSPTNGELGYGESRPKSSTTPQEVKPLDGIYINSVAMGHGHTLFIARDETENDRKRLESLPEYTP